MRLSSLSESSGLNDMAVQNKVALRFGKPIEERGDGGRCFS